MGKLFKGLGPAEQANRKAVWTKMRKEWILSFEAREDVTKNPDGSYDVKGDIDVSEISGTKLPFKLNKVGGNFGCHGCLQTLEGFPSEVGRNLVFQNHDKQFTEDEVRAVCRVHGALKVEFHQGI